ncbi:hypothetical protein [Streptomyces sp. CoH17]|uniref:hypothetical protein n=1 Tax=Streptomyces sp. CoH17 TaxID=2992806 RepID=UPI00226DA825|nr:hypothetical protein [Streptomyces sp. CoH17]
MAFKINWTPEQRDKQQEWEDNRRPYFKGKVLLTDYYVELGQVKERKELYEMEFSVRYGRVRNDKGLWVEDPTEKWLYLNDGPWTMPFEAMTECFGPDRLHDGWVACSGGKPFRDEKTGKWIYHKHSQRAWVNRKTMRVMYEKLLDLEERGITRQADNVEVSDG